MKRVILAMILLSVFVAALVTAVFQQKQGMRKESVVNTGTMELPSAESAETSAVAGESPQIDMETSAYTQMIDDANYLADDNSIQQTEETVPQPMVDSRFRRLDELRFSLPAGWKAEFQRSEAGSLNDMCMPGVPALYQGKLYTDLCMVLTKQRPDGLTSSIWIGDDEQFSTSGAMDIGWKLSNVGVASFSVLGKQYQTEIFERKNIMTWRSYPNDFVFRVTDVFSGTFAEPAPVTAQFYDMSEKAEILTILNAISLAPKAR